MSNIFDYNFDSFSQLGNSYVSNAGVSPAALQPVSVGSALGGGQSSPVLSPISNATEFTQSGTTPLQVAVCNNPDGSGSCGTGSVGTGIAGSSNIPNANAGGTGAGPIPSAVAGSISDYFVRAVVVILGFIFVAIGLNMFRPGTIVVPAVPRVA